MPRALWKGAITFGLVHIPVALYPAAKSDTLDFDWLDKRNMQPVGYKRVNKETGKEVPKDDIVKGLEYEDGHYVVLSDEEIKAANVKATQLIEIVAFVDADSIPPTYFDTPYFLAPTQRGEKVYALLRETLKRTHKIGIALVVLHTKQHLAALMPMERGLLLNTLRWSTEVRTTDEVSLPEAKGIKISEREFQMAKQLVEDMTEKWKPEQYHDTFREDIMALVKRKVEQGKTEIVAEAPAGEGEQKGAQIIDLTELLKRSLRGGKETTAEPKRRAARRKSAAQPSARPARRKTAKASGATKRKRA